MCRTGCFLSYLVLGPARQGKEWWHFLLADNSWANSTRISNFWSSRTILRALSMSMPWLQGTAGLARQSPALPLRETSTRWRRRYRKASAITRMASWVRADVYWGWRAQESPVMHIMLTALLSQPVHHVCSSGGGGGCTQREQRHRRVKLKKYISTQWLTEKLRKYERCGYSRLFKQCLTGINQNDIFSQVAAELLPNNLEEEKKSLWRCLIKCCCSIGRYAWLTFSGVFLASGNSLSSRRSQRWRNCWTMGLSGLMIWKPVMLAPPEMTLSRLMLEKPWEQRTQVAGSETRNH